MCRQQPQVESEPAGQGADERRILRQAKRIVVKIGTRVITAPGEGLDQQFLAGLSTQVAELRKRGCQVIIITSGAVHVGRRTLKLQRKHDNISLRQAAAAVGQPKVMHQYVEAFRIHHITVAQILLTMEDMRDRKRYLHIRNTFEALLSTDVVPVVNENDSVSVESVTFGENDKLAAVVAASVQADVLVFLFDQKGLFDRDPRSSPDAQLISIVRPQEDVTHYAGAAGGPESRGGMRKKIAAARMATECGVAVVMADGKAPGILVDVMAGRQVGTFFVPGTPAPARKLWMATATEPRGAVVVDAGARDALQQSDGASLLPRGIVKVIGTFEAGDIIRILGPDGEEVARGQTNYAADEVERILGAHSSQIKEILGHDGQPEVVHRDYMVLMGR